MPGAAGPCMLAPMHCHRVFPSEFASLPAVRDFVRAVCEDAWAQTPGDRAVWRLELAAHEAASNSIRHACRGRPDTRIEVSVDVAEDEAIITILDDGESFDPKGLPPPDPELRPASGFGLHILRELTDELRFDRENGRNVTTLVFRGRRVRA